MALLTTSALTAVGREAKVVTRRWLAVLALGLAVPLSSPAQAPELKDYQVKAAFLFNFAQFVSWPAGAFADEESPLVIGVLGDDPFGPTLDETVRGEKIGNRPLQVRRYHRVEEIDHCHVLFISQSESRRLGPILSSLRSRSILTVGDWEGFALEGGMIRFINEKNRIRFRINVESAKAAGLTISSKLLRAAEIVTIPGN